MPTLTPTPTATATATARNRYTDGDADADHARIGSLAQSPYRGAVRRQIDRTTVIRMTTMRKTTGISQFRAMTLLGMLIYC